MCHISSAEVCHLSLLLYQYLLSTPERYTYCLPSQSFNLNKVLSLGLLYTRVHFVMPFGFAMVGHLNCCHLTEFVERISYVAMSIKHGLSFPFGGFIQHNELPLVSYLRFVTMWALNYTYNLCLTSSFIIDLLMFKMIFTYMYI